MSSRYLLRNHTTLTTSVLPSARRLFSTSFTRRSSTDQQQHYRDSPLKKQPSAHAQLYSYILPAMVPIFLLGSTIFLGLQLTQLTLSHDKFIQESTLRIGELEAEIEQLQAQRAATAPTTTATATTSSPDATANTNTSTKSRWAFW